MKLAVIFFQANVGNILRSVTFGAVFLLYSIYIIVDSCVLFTYFYYLYMSKHFYSKSEAAFDQNVKNML